MSSPSPQETNRSAAGADPTPVSPSPRSQSWASADNAAGIVLRYLTAMRAQLIQWLGKESLADQCLKLLIAHLVSQGFGTHAKGRMRDFLMRGIRSAAKAVVAEVPEDERVAIDFTTWTPDAASWREHWRTAILARTWRTLERLEHNSETEPLFTILRSAMAHPGETAEMLAIRINTESDIVVDAETIKRSLPQARKRFAQILLDEVGETLDNSDSASVQAELQAIGLTDAAGKLRADI